MDDPTINDYEYTEGYNDPHVEVDDITVFDMEHYKSHFVPRREVIELKKAKDE